MPWRCRQAQKSGGDRRYSFVKEQGQWTMPAGPEQMEVRLRGVCGVVGLRSIWQCGEWAECGELKASKEAAVPLRKERGEALTWAIGKRRRWGTCKGTGAPKPGCLLA